MKLFLLAVSLFVPFTVNAETKVLHQCRITAELPKPTYVAHIAMYELSINEQVYTLMSARRVSGQHFISEIQKAEYSVHLVRPDMGSTNNGVLNLAEKHVERAIIAERDKKFKSSFDLKLIRFAKLYSVGDDAMVIAYGDKGKLGSFLSGASGLFMYSCQE